MQTSVTGSCNSSTVIDVSGPSDKECTQTQDQVDMTCTEWPELVFHPVDEDWQRVVCAVVSLGPTEHTLMVLLWFLDVHTTHRQSEGMVIACFVPFLT